MKTKMIAASLALGIASQAHAGFFDSLFGKKEEAAPVEQAQAATETEKAPKNEKAPASTASAKQDSSIVSSATSLLPTLTKGLGISNEQAEGGMGALLNVAKSSLSSDEFSTLGKGIPGMETLLAAAPALSSKAAGGGLGGLATSLGGAGAALGSLGQVTQQFEALGLSPDMVAQFAKMAVDYFMNSDVNTGELLQKGLSSILG